MHDSFPQAMELSEKGYNAFALIYRPGADTACEDLARAIAFLHENAEELQIDMTDYSLWGGSAGARMAAWLGSSPMHVWGPMMGLLPIDLWKTTSDGLKTTGQILRLKCSMVSNMASDWEKERWLKAGLTMQLIFGKETWDRQNDNKKTERKVMIMKAKKLLSMILIGAASVSLLAGCGSNTSDTQADSEDAAQTESSDNTAQADEQESAEDNTDSSSGSGNVLVVYYSATGNTEEVANYIADTTGGDLFELEPVEPYTDDDLNWSDDNSRVSQEHEDESLRDVELVSTDVENWDSYDTVFIGYPIWWGIAAWPVDSFVENNDFTGKTVIPFCTSASSGIGDSGQLLEEMAGTGDWQEGERFRSGADEADVQEWVNGLGL